MFLRNSILTLCRREVGPAPAAGRGLLRALRRSASNLSLIGAKFGYQGGGRLFNASNACFRNEKSLLSSNTF